MGRPTNVDLYRRRATEWLEEAELEHRGKEHRIFAAAMANAYASLANLAKK